MRRRNTSGDKPSPPKSMTSESFNEPLLPTEAKVGMRFVFYEPDATLEVTRANAEGFIILLTGSGLDSNHAIFNADHAMLAFAAITDGNVIDACFGDAPHGGIKFGGSAYAVKSAANIKSLIRDMAEETSPSSAEQVMKLTIETYTRCFQIIIEYHKEIKKYTFLSRCWKSKKIRKKAEKRLKENFEDLTDLFYSLKRNEERDEPFSLG